MAYGQPTYSKGDAIEIIVEPVSGNAPTHKKLIKIGKPTTRTEACAMCRRAGNKVIDNLKRQTGVDYWWYEGETTWNKK